MLTLLNVREEPDRTIKEYVNQDGCTIIAIRPVLSDEVRKQRMEELKKACIKLMKAKYDLEGWD